MTTQAKNNRKKNTPQGVINLAVELGAGLDRAQDKPLFVQLYSEICRLILSRRLPGGIKLPGSRSLAMDLGLSRTTVLSAYEQLQAEGYIDARRGAGMYVVEGLAEGLMEGEGQTAVLMPVGECQEITTSSRTSGLIIFRLSAGRAYWQNAGASRLSTSFMRGKMAVMHG